MNIERVTDINEILKCLPFEQEVRDKGRDTMKISDMLFFLKDQIGNPMFGFWMAYDDEDDIIGYLSAMMVLLPGMKKLHLLRLYAKDSIVLAAFRDVVKVFCKDFKVKTVMISVSKNVRAIKRKYGFKPVSVTMEMEL